VSIDITPGYLTIAGAASLLGVSKNTVRNLIRDGQIPAVRFGERNVRISVAAIEAAATPVVGGDRGLWSKLT
jgi:excisionase family DNA binding protein